MSQIEQLEMSIEQAKALVERRDLVLKLSRNREFNKIITDGYFKDEAARLVSISGEINHKPHRDEIFDSIKAISHFRQFLSDIVRLGNLAEQEIESSEEYLADLRGENTAPDVQDEGELA